MDYQIENDPYTDAGTGIFRNLINATTQAELDRAEFRITAAETVILNDTPLTGDINLEYMQAIHARLFSNLYPWAGALRTVEIRKGDTEFCKVHALHQFAATIFANLAIDPALSSSDKRVFTNGLTHYYSELNLLHPFREGNGRVLRILAQEIARRHGWLIDWSELDAAENIAACEAAYRGDEAPLVQMLEPLIEPLP